MKNPIRAPENPRLVAAKDDPASLTSALIENEECLRLLVEGVTDYAIFMLDANGYVATWNSGAERIKRYRPDEIVGKHFSVLYTLEERAAGRPDRQLAIAAMNGRVEDEGWRVRGDGTTFWADVVITALYDRDGRVRGYGKITRDLSEKRQAYQALLISEERFRCAFDEAPTGMAMFDVTGCYERVNSAFCAIVGYEPAYLLGVRNKDITHPADIPADAVATRALLGSNARSRSYEKRFIHSAGHLAWVSVNLALVRDPESRQARFIEQIQDIAEQRKHLQQLEFLANHDPLTGLLNRRGFARALDGHLARISRYGPAGSLVMVDLDNFKEYNDAVGHVAGDQFLVKVARVLASRLRESDVLARLGGDEFAVLLPCADQLAARRAARALLNVVRGVSIPHSVDGTNRVTASIGIASFEAGTKTAEEIMVNADVAMYEAKAQGRNRVVHYSGDLRES